MFVAFSTSQAGRTVNENGRTQQDGGSADKLMKYIYKKIDIIYAMYICMLHIPNLDGASNSSKSISIITLKMLQISFHL